MESNTKKLLIYSIGFVFALAGLLLAYTHSQTAGIASWHRSGGGWSRGESAKGVPGQVPVTAEDRETAALVARDLRRVRSPAFVPGDSHSPKLKASVERLLANPRVAAIESHLKETFPDTSPMGFWIRAAIALGNAPSTAEMSPEAFESASQAYALVLNGEESSIAALDAGLQAIPRTDVATRRQAFRMLSDIGLKNRELRENVKSVLLAEATRAGGHPDGALAFSSLLRMNPSKEWAQELGRAYEMLHPGSELSDFVALNVANL